MELADSKQLAHFFKLPNLGRIKIDVLELK